MKKNQGQNECAVTRKLSKAQMAEAKKLCQELPMIEDRLRRAGLFATAAAMNMAVVKIGYEVADLAPPMCRNGKGDMTRTHTPTDAVQVSQAELADHIKFFGTIGRGKSMLSRLNEAELHEWWKWAKANPNINGMDWPGWAAVRAREAAAMPGDAAQNTAGLVYNDAFCQGGQKSTKQQTVKSAT